MSTMNHTNLTTYNVPALTEFFCSVFGFQLVEKRTDKLSVLRNAEGFVLTLMYDKRMTPEQGYPGMFHVGFLQPTQHAVDLVHDDLSISKLHGAETGEAPARRTANIRLL
ncbi:MAG TPA: VOC family protein, partial [Verrucomicrobiae bacterium]|nr:VOC family protein [Verrucomicrobiae bacterium]